MQVIDTSGAKYPMRAIKFTEKEIDQMLITYGTTDSQDEINKVRDDLPMSFELLVGCLVIDGIDGLLDGNYNVVEAIEEEGMDLIDVLIARYNMHEFEYWRKRSTQFKGLGKKIENFSC
jgi:hypothetical protein